VAKWRQAIASGSDITITDPTATRFFLTRDVAIGALFECLSKAPDSRPYFPVMKALSIRELLDVMILKYGNGRQCQIIEVGLQAGENKHEHIDRNTTSEFAPRWTQDEIYAEI
jgi:FlaA1/EpsC-like NDP-sugar epimerase